MMQMADTNRDNFSLLSDDDLYLFNEGSHIRLYERLGAHPLSIGDKTGTYFAVWAPNARRVSVAGDFNGWDKQGFELRPRQGSGIWEGFIPGVGSGMLYKYHIDSNVGRFQVDKADPFAFHSEQPPKTASVICDLSYDWEDSSWMNERKNRNASDRALKHIRGPPRFVDEGARG